MKRFIASIKSQIQQFKNLSFGEWLLSHLNEDAKNLRELFSKQFPASTQYVLATTPFSRRFPPHFTLSTLIFTYAPEVLRQELMEKRAESPELEDESIIDIRLAQRIIDKIADYSDAWPIITLLQTQGTADLIKILDNTDEKTLMAFARVTKGSDLSILIDTLLVKNSYDLELVDRNRLIQFLRQPDLAGWLTEYLKSLVAQSTNVMSLKLLMLTFTPSINEQDKITELRSTLTDYPFSIHLEVMLVLIDFYSQGLQKESNDTFIFLLHELLNRVDFRAQSILINGVNQKHLLLIIDQCLQGSISSNSKLQQVCMDVLFVCCSQSVVAHKETLVLIKERLKQPDAYLFEIPELLLLAKQVINNANESLDGPWIELLLTSPRFVAASTARVLKQLGDRYCLLSTTLNQIEYNQLILSFQELIPHQEAIQSALFRINQNSLNHPEASDYWQIKRHQLLKFSSASMVHALLLQLENSCEQQKTSDSVITFPSELTENALVVLYSYYSQTVPNLRTDLLFRAVNFAYRPLIDHDATWFKHYFPSHPQSLFGLQRKKEVMIYNATGQQIGFINEANEAMAFVADEPVLLIKTGSVKVHSPLYDDQGSIIAYLTGTGLAKNAELVQKNVSARLLALLPVKDLEKSPWGLDLLVKNVLLEDTLEDLYIGEYSVVEGAKRLWLDQQFSASLRNMELALSPTTVGYLVNHHQSVFSLLGTMKCKINALALFHGLLNQDKSRELMFRSFYKSEVQLFLDRYEAVPCFVDFMIHYHEKAWFAEGLSCFAAYGKKQKKNDLLGDALALLHNRKEQDEQNTALIDSVLDSLVKTEASARVLMQEFLNDHPQLPIEELNCSGINNVTRFFNKRHLLTALYTLNTASDWENSSLYKLVLYIFAAKQEIFFPSNEFYLAAKYCWKGKELNILAEFILRHLANKNSVDTDQSIGYRVFGELIFRCANTGQISLFYNKTTFAPAIARLSFTRPFLERVVDKFWIPEGIKEQFTDTVARIKTWFAEQSILQQELELNLVLMDWRHLIKQTWQEINKKKLPIICAYLLNYEGSKKTLVVLLNDYFNTFQKNADYLHPVGKLMQQFPQRDVSAVIFDSLEVAIIKEPELLDRTILQQMAYYYAKKIMNTEAEMPQAELNLLIYFGQNKQYSLAQKGCEYLAKECSDKQLKKRLLKGLIEAKVEADLSSSSGRFYFGLIKIINRLWYYGLNAKKNSSGIVRFCDSQSSNLSRKYADKQVKSPVVSRQVSSVYLDFSEKRKQLIKLLAGMKHCPVSALLSAQTLQSRQRLFQPDLQTGKGIQEKVVAAEQAVVNM